MDELEFWQPGMRLFSFTEPTPLFYEEAGWSSNTRQDRLATLTSLAGYHLPGVETKSSPPVTISSAKSLMTRTMPRRDYLKSILRIANNTQKPQKQLDRAASSRMGINLQRSWSNAGDSFPTAAG